LKRGTLVSLTTLGLALVILACPDLTRPLDQPGLANRLLTEAGPVTVSPGAMHGWAFYNDQNDTACTDAAVCRMVDGHTTYGTVVLEAGSSWPGFRGNVDALAIGVSGVTTTFDFELSDTSMVPASAPDSIPTALWDSVSSPANILQDPPGVTGSVIRDLVYVSFVPGASVNDRQAAIDLVHGRVIGGLPIGAPERFYAVRLPYVLGAGDSTSGPILRAQAALSQLPAVWGVVLARMDIFKPMYVRPHDGPEQHGAESANAALAGPGALTPVQVP
jgi:hypothetical protein